MQECLQAMHAVTVVVMGAGVIGMFSGREWPEVMYFMSLPVLMFLDIVAGDFHQAGAMVLFAFAFIGLKGLGWFDVPQEVIDGMKARIAELEQIAESHEERL